jgi:acyl-CoA thioester hydrolase, YbgC/YbaW family
MPHVQPITVYYEDTDFTGLVYHANYLKFMERAREHLLGMDAQRQLWEREGLGFAVYRCECRFRSAARHADQLEVRTTVTSPTPYRAVFAQDVHRAGEDKPLVEGIVELVCIDRAGGLQRMPAWILDAIVARSA